MENLLSFFAVGVGVLGVLMLHMFFRVVETKWPTSYYSVTDFLAYNLSAHPFRYMAFRFGPVFVVAAFCGVIAFDLGLQPWITGSVIGLFHAAVNDFRALAQIARRRQEFALLLRTYVHFVIGLLAIGVALFGTHVSQYRIVRLVVPSPGDVILSLWIALLAGIVGAYLIRISARGERSESALVNRSLLSIPVELIAFAEHHSVHVGADPLLVQAVMLTENLQRPRWIRRVESLSARLGLKSTRGIMQVSDETVTNDRHSIQIAVDRFFAGVAVEDGPYSINSDLLQATLLRYNPSSEFVKFAETLYYTLRERAKK